MTKEHKKEIEDIEFVISLVSKKADEIVKKIDKLDKKLAHHDKELFELNHLERERDKKIAEIIMRNEYLEELKKEFQWKN